MTPKINLETFPFSITHLKKLKEEISEAGTFDELMIRKKAIHRVHRMKYIAQYKDIDRYKRKYLNGVYQTLHPMYDTDTPYIFWADMNEMLSKYEASIQNHSHL